MDGITFWGGDLSHATASLQPPPRHGNEIRRMRLACQLLYECVSTTFIAVPFVVCGRGVEAVTLIVVKGPRRPMTVMSLSLRWANLILPRSMYAGERVLPSPLLYASPGENISRGRRRRPLL